MHLLALFLVAAPVAAAPAPPPDVYPTTAGTMGVSFVLPGSAVPTIGATYFVADDLAARLDFGLDAPLSPTGAGQNVLFSVAGALRMYKLKKHHVGVYL